VRGGLRVVGKQCGNQDGLDRDGIVRGMRLTFLPLLCFSVVFLVLGIFCFCICLCLFWHTCLYRVDIYNRLYRERIIFLGSEIDDELANQVIGVMLYLDSEDNTKPIYLYINSPGGSVISGLAIFDCMQHIKSEVITINLGLAASMGSFILAAGSKGKRLALPSSRTMIHQPMGGARGQAEDIKVEAAQIMRVRDNLVKSYSMMTGQTQDQIIKDLDRDNFLSAYDAVEYGLVDRVLDYNKDTDTQL
jgi:ATP-dependent Clp protease, protease subunit